MSRLNPIEKEACEALAIILDLMGPGKRHVTVNEHTELMGRVRDAYHHLVNKDFGCETGLHSGTCNCPKAVV